MINNEIANKVHTIISGVTEYPIGFAFGYNPDYTPQLRVYVNKLSDYPLQFGVDYKISDDQLNVVLLTEQQAGDRLDIIRDIPMVQLSDYVIGRIDPEQIENDFDLSVERDQQLKAELEIAIDLPLDHEHRIQAAEHRLDNIEDKIPEQATVENQLADKNFVNSSIATNTAEFKGTYTSVSDLNNIQDADNNDYAFVISTDELGHTLYNRYKYNGTAWVYEYTLNNSSFTAAQWAAINSGVTSETVAKVNNMPVLIKQISVNESTGVISIVAHTNITSMSVKKLYGGTVAGTVSISGASATFTPSTVSDITVKEWTIEVA